MNLFCSCTKSNQSKDDILNVSLHNGLIINDEDQNDNSEDTIQDKNETCNIFSFFNIFCWKNK